MGMGKPRLEKGKRCPFKMTGAPTSKVCERQHCAIWTGTRDNGECAILLLALNSSTIIKHISPVDKS